MCAWTDTCIHMHMHTRLYTLTHIPSSSKQSKFYTHSKDLLVKESHEEVRFFLELGHTLHMLCLGLPPSRTPGLLPWPSYRNLQALPRNPIPLLNIEDLPLLKMCIGFQELTLGCSRGMVAQ